MASIRCWRLSLREAEGCHCVSSLSLYDSGPSALHKYSTSTADAAIRYHGVGGVTQIPAAALEVTPAEAAVVNLLHWVDIDFI